MSETQLPNYMKKMARLFDAGVIKRGELLLLNVAHDDWCAIYHDKPCDCDPDITDRETGEKICVYVE